MTQYVIIGAGVSGLYTAYRLLKSGNLNSGDTVKLYEWAERPGGRIYTYRFPSMIENNGLYCDFGAMRFVTDVHFPNAARITEGHVLLQHLIIDLDLERKVVPFERSSNRLYYLRGVDIYEDQISNLDVLPYNFHANLAKILANKVQAPYTADSILAALARELAPGLGASNCDRRRWCSHYANFGLPLADTTLRSAAESLPQNDSYWSALYSRLGNEGVQYLIDGTGYFYNIVNLSLTDGMRANGSYAPSVCFQRLDGGYSLLCEMLAAKIAELSKQYPGSGIFYGHQLTGLSESTNDNSTTCIFRDHNNSYRTYSVQADELFLAMPRRSLELVGKGCSAEHMMNNAKVRYYFKSVVEQDVIKVGLIFDQAWWTGVECRYPPRLVLPSKAPPETPKEQWVGGATVTDLPCRMIYYFSNNVVRGPGISSGPYLMLVNYSHLWRELECWGLVSPGLIVEQSLAGPIAVAPNSSAVRVILKQLAEIHGIDTHKMPLPKAVYFQDWGRDPFGGGYHAWAAHYDICQVMDGIRAPYQKVLNDFRRKVYVIGSCYSFDQAWVEGALCTAESVLQDFVGLRPLNSYIAEYKLIC